MKRSLLYNSILKIFSNNFFCVEMVKEKLKNEIFMILFVLLNSQFISSQSFGDWQFLGLENENITAIAGDWSNPDIIYAGSSSNFSTGTAGGIFKSTNAGADWDTLIRGVTVRDIDIHPKNPEIIYAALGLNVLTQPGIIKTTDA